MLALFPSQAELPFARHSAYPRQCHQLLHFQSNYRRVPSISKTRQCRPVTTSAYHRPIYCPPFYIICTENIGAAIAQSV